MVPLADHHISVLIGVLSLNDFQFKWLGVALSRGGILFHYRHYNIKLLIFQVSKVIKVIRDQVKYIDMLLP